MDFLQSDRLAFYQLTLADSALMLRLLNEESFLRNIGDRGVRTLAQAEQYLQDGPLRSYQQHGFGMYRVVRKADGVNIGLAGLVFREYLGIPDVGYALLPEFSGAGYASEAALAVYLYGKTVLNLPAIVGIVAPDNLASKKILEKIGLVTEKQILSADTDKWLDYYTEPK
ncbi:MAG: GNAT family N-acetyltransferase [Gammaproteobacteria bacterium]|jgi:[ribosomal protein S5]-alanine N-acetyltransferase|nr:GNAT family N-acetyltransferase [Gammaproteobacteria bacterium]MBU2177853.1 GNAT family N-acetyltransferase [Gammaproteobacteria bacterium]MBU2225383.1 GNAT family N-acetyltransferase [Gammaproteobacteria bacterium]